MLAAVATDRRDVSINAPLTNDERDRLSRAGMFVGTGNSVSREQAIDAIVKLYELKTRRRITGHQTVANSSLTDIRDVAAFYQTSVLKARHIGLIGGNRVDPREGITFGDVLGMFDLIILDAGL
jgi:hypothetical protein